MQASAAASGVKGMLQKRSRLRPACMTLQLLHQDEEASQQLLQDDDAADETPIMQVRSRKPACDCNCSSVELKSMPWRLKVHHYFTQLSYHASSPEKSSMATAAVFVVLPDHLVGCRWLCTALMRCQRCLSWTGTSASPTRMKQLG